LSCPIASVSDRMWFSRSPFGPDFLRCAIRANHTAAPSAPRRIRPPLGHMLAAALCAAIN
jgi:hypothetical protein